MSDAALRAAATARTAGPAGPSPELMQYQVRNVLYVSTLYESFILAEDGLLNEHMQTKFLDLHFLQIPQLVHAATGSAALQLLESGQSFELVLVGLHVGDMDLPALLQGIRKASPQMAVALLAHDYAGLKQLRVHHPSLPVAGTFLWQGDARLLLAIVKLVEDRRNLEHDTRLGVPVFLVVEDSVRNYSSFLPTIYAEVMRHVQRITSEGVSLAERLVRLRARPKILLATTFEEAWSLFDEHRDDVLGVISDVDFPRGGRSDPRAGFELAARIRELRPDVPVTLHSSRVENAAAVEASGCAFLNKRSADTLQQLRHQLSERFFFGDFTFRDAGGNVLARAADLAELIRCVGSVPAESLAYHGGRNDFSRWLRVRAELELGQRLRPIRLSDYRDLEALRRALMAAIEQYRQRRSRATVADFAPEHFEHNGGVSRIGGGSFGGKARGLAFAAKLLDTAELTDRFPGVRIEVPPAVVLATDIFQQFLDLNDLRAFALACEDDLERERRFRAASLPPAALSALASLAQRRDLPLAIRSSSLIEDSPLQPFAGVFETVMVSNAQRAKTLRLRALQRSVATVYASAFSRQARRLLDGTPYRLEELDMAVVIQKLVGQRHGSRFYPDLAGVARSFNAYPREPATSRDGIAAVALGLGKTVVEGEPCWRFSPAHPRHGFVHSNADELLDNAQRQFWALSMAGHDRGKLVRCTLDVAEHDGVLDPLGSTYSPENGTVVDGISRPGVRFVSLAGVLKHGLLPLGEILRELLALFERAMGSHVELEFAADLTPGPDGRRQFAVLQARPLALQREEHVIPVSLDALPRERVLCRSGNVLGGTHVESIHDLLVADPRGMHAAANQEAAAQLARLNADLLSQGRPYILIGAGRWGSSHAQFGIPVAWDDVSGAQAIVEGVSDSILAAPSEGSHLFQNLLTAGTHYFSVRPRSADDHIDWDWLESQSAVQQAGAVRHLRFSRPLLLLVDGVRRCGVICKPEPDQPA